MIPETARRRMLAAKALFDSPNAGEADAARQAYARLVKKHGDPEAEAKSSFIYVDAKLTPDQVSDLLNEVFGDRDTLRAGLR